MHPIFLFRQWGGKYMREKTFIWGILVFFLLKLNIVWNFIKLGKTAILSFPDRYKVKKKAIENFSFFP